MIDSLDNESAVVVLLDPNVVADHQLRKPLPIDENHRVADCLDVLPSIVGEVRSCDKYTLPRAPALEAANKALYLRSSDPSLPALRLDANRLKPKRVLNI